MCTSAELPVSSFQCEQEPSMSLIRLPLLCVLSAPPWSTTWGGPSSSGCSWAPYLGPTKPLLPGIALTTGFTSWIKAGLPPGILEMRALNKAIRFLTVMPSGGRAARISSAVGISGIPPEGVPAREPAGVPLAGEPGAPWAGRGFLGRCSVPEASVSLPEPARRGALAVVNVSS